MQQSFSHWSVPMMQDIICKLVRNIWKHYPDYVFDPETMRLYLLEDISFRYPWLIGQEIEDLITLLHFEYLNTEGKMRFYGRDFAIQEAAAYLPKSGVPPSPLYLLDPINNLLFSLLGLGADASGEQSTKVVAPQEVPAEEG